jgi:hypothetical protein
MWRPLIAHAGGADETLSLILLFAGLWTGWIGWSRLRGRGLERLPRWGGVALTGVALALVIAAAFVPQLILRSSTTPAATGPRPSSPVTLQIVEPADGAHTDADQLTVRIEVHGGTLTQTTSTSIAPDTGHLHLLLDGAIVSMSGDTLQVVDIRNLADGGHTLTAEFVATDHLPFDPPVTESVTFVKYPGATAG